MPYVGMGCGGRRNLAGMRIPDQRASDFRYYVHGDGGDLTYLTHRGQPYGQPTRLAQTEDDTGVAVSADAKFARVDLDIQLLDRRPATRLSGDLDAGWDAGAEISAEFAGPILVRDDINERWSGPVGQGPGRSRVRLLVRGEGGEQQAHDNSVPPQEHWIRIWPEPTPRPPEAEDRTGMHAPWSKW